MNHLTETVAGEPFHASCEETGTGTTSLSWNDAVPVPRSCDAPSQSVGATPPSREINNAPFGGPVFGRGGRRPHRLRRRRRSYSAASSLFNGIVPAESG